MNEATGDIAVAQGLLAAPLIPLKRTVVSRIGQACDACRSKKARCSGRAPCEGCIRSQCACIYTPNARKRKVGSSGAAIAAADRQYAGRSAAIPIDAPTITHENTANERSLVATDISGALQPAFVLSLLEDAKEALLQDFGVNVPAFAHLPLELLVLPERTEVEDRCKAYLKYAHTQLPILRTSTLQSAFSRVFDTPEPPATSQSSYLLLHACMALGIVMASDTLILNEEALIRAQEHQQRIRDIIKNEAMGKPRLLTLQLLLLQVQYNQAIGQIDAAWALLGLAIQHMRALKLDKSPVEILPASEMEEQRRTWWSCWLLDAELSVALGRTTVMDIVSPSIPLPKAVDDEHLDSGCDSQPLESLSRVELFIQTIKLYKIALRGERELPFPRAGHASLRRLQAILAFDVELDVWQTELPVALSIEAPGIVIDGWLQRQRSILHCRLYRLRVMLFRSSLIRLAGLMKAHLTFFESLCDTASKTCLSTCHQLVQLSRSACSRHSGTLTRFECMNNMYLACSVLLAARCNGVHYQALSETSWSEAIDTLAECNCTKAVTFFKTINTRFAQAQTFDVTTQLLLEEIAGQSFPMLGLVNT